MFYALNMMGGIPNMVHPLSSEEIEFYLNLPESKGMLVLDAFYPKVAAIRSKVPACSTLSWRPSQQDSPWSKAWDSKPPKDGKSPKSAKVNRWSSGRISWTKRRRGKAIMRLTKRKRSGSHPVQRWHLRHHQRHPAFQPELQCPGHANRSSGTNLAARPENAFHHAHFPWIWAGHRHPYVPDHGGMLPFDSSIQRGQLCGIVENRSNPINVPAHLEALHRNKRMDGVVVLPHRRLFRRGYPVGGTEEEKWMLSCGTTTPTYNFARATA